MDMLKSMIKGTSQAKADDAEAKYNFLLCIESLIKLVDGTNDSSQLRAVVTSIKSAIDKYESSESRDSQQDGGDNVGVPLQYQSQFVEILIGAVAFGIAIGKIVEQSEQTMDHLDTLIYAYKFVPINPRYARFTLHQFGKNGLGRFAL
jgi:hypothetical protein